MIKGGENMNKGTPKAIWFKELRIFKELKLLSVHKGFSIEKTIEFLIKNYFQKGE